MAYVWNQQQDRALKSVIAWIKDRKAKQVFRLFGFAGTGKTTLAQEIANQIKGMVLFAAYTGKAAIVLKTKGCESASTIHSLIYRFEEDGDGGYQCVLNPNSKALDAALIIIDEGSMVDEVIGKDLLSFGKKVLVLGDPFQLAPPNGAGFFTQQEPDIMLTDVERQAKDNPIIALSREIREGNGLKYGVYGDTKVIRRKDVRQAEVIEADQILVGRNVTRSLYNNRVREIKGFTGTIPGEGERLVCLRNNRTNGLLNGSLWDTVSADVCNVNPDAVELTVRSADWDANWEVSTLVPRAFFVGEESKLEWNELRDRDQFTYGHALTVHKAQGSQWPNVYLFDESRFFRDQRWRHLYVGLTRAEKRATVVL